MKTQLTFASRPSALARWQTEHIIAQLCEIWPELECRIEIITTRGDRILDKPLPEIGGKGLFTLELEEALRAGTVDAAVHSLKDLPTEDSTGLTVGVIPRREDARDVWICPAGHTLETIPEGAVIGTASNRRHAQLIARRPDLQIKMIRGNVDTRIRKVREGQYDAIILAAAGVRRLGLDEHVTEYIPLDKMLPAPGQGALAVQCRAGDRRVLDLLQPLEDKATRMAVEAERAYLEGLGGGCSLPIGAYANVDETHVTLRTVSAAAIGDELTLQFASGPDPVKLGKMLAKRSRSEELSRMIRETA